MAESTSVTRGACFTDVRCAKEGRHNLDIRIGPMIR